MPKLRWMKRLDGSLELQLVDQLGEWKAIPIVTEVSEQEASENQRLAAEIGIAPSQVQHMRALGLLTIPPVPEPRGPGA